MIERRHPAMRVAVLNDIHGNLPALEAVLSEVRQHDIDQIVVGGDVFPGPMPRETLEYLLGLELPVQFIYGNGELAMLAQMAATDPSEVTYWGTTSGFVLPEPIRELMRWSARQLYPDYQQLLASWPMTLRLAIDGLGEVLFCHGTPRSEVEVFTRLTPEAPLLPVFEGLNVAVVVCGHTHMQFDRTIGSTRVINSGSVGMPFGEPRADWLLLGPLPAHDLRLHKGGHEDPGHQLSAGGRLCCQRHPAATGRGGHARAVHFRLFPLVLLGSLDRPAPFLNKPAARRCP
jgi:predicted phosphodiesterase